MMDQPIKNIDELRAEISRLRDAERAQSIAISNRFNTPSALFSTIFSIFPKSKDGNFFDQDLVTMLSRFLLPITLNKTIFRHSGFIVKTIVGLVSQKASNFINEDTLTGLWDKVKTIFKKKTEDAIPEHRAIPALSETY